jgi:phage recombination protein Bet
MQVAPAKPQSVLARMAQTYGIEPEKMLGTLKATAFKGDVSNEQMMALLVVAEQYQLNPWTKEIYAFPDRNHGIVPVVGVDGWSRIINSHPMFDGMDFEEGPLSEQRVPEWIECKMYRKDRSHPICVKEYFSEVKRDVTPWKSHPRRMLRHKAMIQCARLAFGFVGIYDDDEAERIKEAIDVTPARVDPRGDLTEVNYEMRDKHVAAITDLCAELGSDEAALGAALKDYVATHLREYQELYITVADRLAELEILSKANFRKLLK